MNTPTPPRPYSVSQLNREVRMLLESGLPVVSLEAEISNFSRPASGHWYFTLKDDKAQVRCAMFRNRNQLLRKTPANGDQVLIRARIGLYEARGEYQLVAESMEDAGAGQLRQRFEQLKKKLEGEGLFDSEHKQPLPAFPQRIGLITSPTGAAVRDMINVLSRRYPAAELILYPAAVQGDAAANDIMEAINHAVLRDEADVLIVGRGGGSAEDLAAFNDEALAYVIHACHIPTVSAVGHEIDFTIADFVADQRAATPSAAAELVSPDGLELRQRVNDFANRMLRVVSQGQSAQAQTIGNLERRLLTQHPSRRLQDDIQRADDAERRLHRQVSAKLTQTEQRLGNLTQRLLQLPPKRKIELIQPRLEQCELRMQSALGTLLERRNNQLRLLARTLNTVSPLATLDRGYSITTTADGSVLQSGEETKIGESLSIRLSKGELACRVEHISE